MNSDDLAYSLWETRAGMGCKSNISAKLDRPEQKKEGKILASSYCQLSLWTCIAETDGDDDKVEDVDEVVAIEVSDWVPVGVSR